MLQHFSHSEAGEGVGLHETPHEILRLRRYLRPLAGRQNQTHNSFPIALKFRKSSNEHDVEEGAKAPAVGGETIDASLSLRGELHLWRQVARRAHEGLARRSIARIFREAKIK